MTVLNTASFHSGKQYPPQRMMSRIQDYEKYYRWSQGDFICQTATPQLRFESNPAPLALRGNFFAVVKDFWANSVGRPVIEAEDNNPRAADFLAKLSPNLAEATALVTGDLIRYGIGVLYSPAPLQIQALDPRYFYPIAPAYAPSMATGEAVVAYPFNDNPDEYDNTHNKLFIAEHTREPQARIAKLDGLTIGATVETLNPIFVDGQVVPVMLGDARSDYIDIAPYVFALSKLETELDSGLSRHINPHLSVPENSLIADATGKITLQKDGMVIPTPDNASTPAYVTFEPSWPGHHEAVDRYIGRILRFSKISEIFFSARKFEGLSVPSGAALRRLATTSVQRLQLIQSALTEAYRRVLPAQAALLAAGGGERIPISDISVTWPPAFSTAMDEGDNVRALIDSGALSRELALQLVEGISRREAENKLQQGGNDNANGTQRTTA